MGGAFSCCLPAMFVNKHNVQIIKKIGEGGFSHVYEVRDAKTGQKLALKVMLCQTPHLLEASVPFVHTLPQICLLIAQFFSEANGRCKSCQIVHIKI